MWKQALFQPAQENQREFQAFGRMKSHQRDLRFFIIGIGIADQRGVVQKLSERLAAIPRIHRSIHQFAQVFDA